MAVCQDSWLDWSADAGRVAAVRAEFGARFKESEAGSFVVPVGSVAALGMKVALVYPNSIGMARGFSVAVESPFESAIRNVEKALGTALNDRDTDEGMRT